MYLYYRLNNFFCMIIALVLMLKKKLNFEIKKKTLVKCHEQLIKQIYLLIHEQLNIYFIILNRPFNCIFLLLVITLFQVVIIKNN